MARLRRREINAIGAPNKPTGFAHSRGDRGEILRRYVRGGSAGAYVAVADLEGGDELIQVLNLSSSNPAAAGTSEPADIRGELEVVSMFEIDYIEVTEAGAEYSSSPVVTISNDVPGTSEVVAGAVTVALDAVDTDGIGVFTYTTRGVFSGPITVTFAAPTGGDAADRVTATGIVHLREIDARIKMSSTTRGGRRLACTIRQDR